MRTVMLSLALAAIALSDTKQNAYPVVPHPLPDADEIALATSAAPAAISARAEVWAARSTGAVKIRAGSSGIACAVVRDLHEGSLYPICFDAEAARSQMRLELLKTTLRAKGMAEDKVERELAAAFARGELHAPAKPAISYMMSPRQVLFSSPFKSGQRIGAWHPHLMISTPGMTVEQLGILPTTELEFLQLDNPGKPDAQLIVTLPSWSDGKSAASHP